MLVNKKTKHTLNLTDPNEFITDIKAHSSYFIFYLEITTNLGTVFSVGTPKISAVALKNECNMPGEEPKVEVKSISIPKGSQVHCLAGCYEKYLQSL